MKSSGRQQLRRFVHHPVTNVAVVVLILASIVTLVVELATPPGPLREALAAADAAFTLVFALELLLRFLAEHRKRRFFRQHWVDILAVIPFLRLLRVLRVFRLLSAFRIGIALSRRFGWLDASLQRGAMQGFGAVVVVTAMVLFGAIGFHLAEPSARDIGESMWWSIMSLIAGEPIGELPQTTLGRLVTVGVMLSGLTAFAMLTGLISAAMIHRLGHIDRNAMDIEDLEDHLIICGWNRSCANIVTELQGDPCFGEHPIVVVGEFEGEPDWGVQFRYPHMIFVVRGDCTRLEVLERAGIYRASQAIIVADRLVEQRSDQDRDARTVLTAALIERVKGSIFTSVELLNRDNESFLRTVGVDEIIVATEYAGSLIATSTRTRGIVKVFDELVTSRYGNQLYKVPVPRAMRGCSYGELVARLKSEYDALLIGLDWPTGVEGPTRGLEVNPPAEREVVEGVLLVVVARERPRWA